MRRRHRMLAGIRTNLAVRNKCGGPKYSKVCARMALNKDALYLGRSALAGALVKLITLTRADIHAVPEPSQWKTASFS